MRSEGSRAGARTGKRRRRIGILLLCSAVSLCAAPALWGKQHKVVYSDQEKPVLEQLRGLRQLPDQERAKATKELALEIRALPTSRNKTFLAKGLANLSTEGDFGHDTLQEVATTLELALREQPDLPAPDRADMYGELASLARYEHVQVADPNAQFTAAIAKLEAEDRIREKADFSLQDMQGTRWALSQLRGKVVLVNFWATWCPPCRKEIPDLEKLYRRFGGQGLVILGISDEDMRKVEPFVSAQKITYPILLDPGSAVHKEFAIEGIPKNLVYDRAGKLVAESIDMRTEHQFLEMLAQAGLQ